MGADLLDPLERAKVRTPTSMKSVQVTPMKASVRPLRVRLSDCRAGRDNRHAALRGGIVPLRAVADTGS
jgi:hypothetical protein